MEIKREELPDVKALLAVEARMAELFYGQTARLFPVLRERLLDLTELVKAGNDAMRENVLSSLVALNLDLDNASALDEEDLLRLCQALQADMKAITQAIEQVSGYPTPDVKVFRQEHDAQVVKQRSQVVQFEQTVAEQQDRLTEVDNLLKTLDQPSVRKALRNLIPQEKDIDTVFASIKDPTVSPDLVRAALEKLNTHLDLLEQGRKYADVVAARGQLATRLSEQKQTLGTLQRKLEEIQETSSQYEGAEELLSQRVLWVEQTKKFVSRWQMLSRQISTSVQMVTLQSALEDARDYLVALRRCFEVA